MRITFLTGHCTAGQLCALLLKDEYRETCTTVEPPEAIGRVPVWEKRLTALFQFGEHQFGDFAQGFKHSLACDGDALSHGFALHLELLG